VTEDALDEIVLASAFAELAGGPLTLNNLTLRLRRRGALAHYDGLGDDALAELVDEILLETDDTWMSEDGIVALTTTMFSGAVLSHRITESEIERGVLDATPDLGAIGFDSAGGLELSTGGTLKCCFPFDGEPELDENGSFVGPANWLSSVRAGDIVCIRRQGRTLSVEVTPDPGPGEAEEAALRAAFDVRNSVDVGAEAEELVMDALCHDPTLFRSPVVPIAELLDRAGLEQRGGWFGLRGVDWEPPGVRHRERLQAALRDSWGFDPCCEAAFEIVQAAWGDHVLHRGTPSLSDQRPVARALGHGSVAPAFAEYVLGNHDYGSDPLESFVTGLSDLPGSLAAPGLYLRALNAEREGNSLLAEADLESAVLADPEFGPGLAELAWYADDRGDARRAVSLLRRSGASNGDRVLVRLESRLVASTVKQGRNDPCSCGSGRKFKTCCLNNPAFPIETRAGWLYEKVVAFTVRPARREIIDDLFDIAGEHALPAALEQLLPVLVDIAAFEAGAISDFVEERGELLPPDELALARSWIASRLALWEVVDVEPGSTVTVRDTLTGDNVVVTERMASQDIRRGEYLLARVMPAGSQHKVFGSPLEMDLRRRDSLIQLFDSDPDPTDLASWLGMAFGPPVLVNREGEDTLMCRAVLRPKSTPWDELANLLDEIFGEDDDGRWTDVFDLDGELIVRCFLRRDGDDLVVETNSVPRFDRLLSTLREKISDDLEVIEEERLTLSEARARQSEMGSPVPFPMETEGMPAEAVSALQDLVQQKETAWLDDHIPALGGITPREAADDPTRRPDLIALLNEFDSYGDGPPGTLTFDVSRLRQQLGISPES
jgi:hypothetical protein